jgi:Ca2+-binding EF-hand superfamily protein
MITMHLCGRLKDALQRMHATTAELAFRSFANPAADGTLWLSTTDLVEGLRQKDSNLTPHERQLLVSKMDVNKDGRISLR